MKRRHFLQTTAALTATALTAQLSRPLLAMPHHSSFLDTIGLQLWTVRDQLAKDELATLKSVADAGYKQIELMSVLNSDSIVTSAKELGLNVTSGFINWQSICQSGEPGVPSVDDIIAKAKEMELQHLVFGYIGKGFRETSQQMKKIAASANEAGQKAADKGIQMCYHNHAFEFEKIDGDTTGFDVFIQEFDPEVMKFELDVFWAKIGGHDPIEMMKSLTGRISQVHLKDLKEGTDVIYDEGKVPADAFQECGDGTIDMAAVMALASEIGAVNCHVEQDQSPDPIASIGQSIDHLNGLSS
jgi:sugar phosphate isomerase/epimerase